jgi:hypothetical protein
MYVDEFLYPLGSLLLKSSCCELVLINLQYSKVTEKSIYLRYETIMDAHKTQKRRPLIRITVKFLQKLHYVRQQSTNEEAV